jgi:hypothetical protein
MRPNKPLQRMALRAAAERRGVREERTSLEEMSRSCCTNAIFFDPAADVAMIGAYNTAGGNETAPATGDIMTDMRVRALEVLFPLFWRARAQQ